MARDVRQKIAEGKDLDEDDLKYARERGIETPGYEVTEGYEVSGEEEAETDLESMTKQELADYAASLDPPFEVSTGWKKEEMVQAIQEATGE